MADAEKKSENPQDNGNVEESKALQSDEKVDVKIVYKNNDTKLELGSEPKQHGLTKEELMKYASDPFWIRLRWSMFILFWLAWLAMLVASIIIIVYAPKCPSPVAKDWFQKGPIYSMDVKKFKDSDGDNVGDLQGLEDELDYLVSAGINTLLLRSIYKTADDSGAVVNNRELDPELGTIENWVSLVEQLQTRDLKVVIDFEPNHVSADHDWFKKSVAKEAGFENFFVWEEGSQSSPPNKAISTKAGGSGWTWNDARGAWYLHNHGAYQPDLNLKNDEVLKALKGDMAYWINKGVNGFNIQSVDVLVEDFENGQGDVDGSQEVLDYLRSFLNEESEDGETKILMANTNMAPKDVGYLYGDMDESGSGKRVQLTVSASFLPNTQNINVQDLLKSFGSYMKDLPERAWPAFSLQGRSSQIAASQEMEEMLTMLTMLLPGTPIIPMGDNQGDASVVPNDALAAPSFAKMAALRHDPAILYGSYEFKALSDSSFTFTRVKKGYPGYMLGVNLDPTKPFVLNHPSKLKLYTRTGAKSDDEPADENEQVASGARVYMFVPKFD